MELLTSTMIYSLLTPHCFYFPTFMLLPTSLDYCQDFTSGHSLNSLLIISFILADQNHNP